MGAIAPRDWTEQHDGPPPLADAKVLVLPERRLLWRAGVPTGVVGALLLAYGIWGEIKSRRRTREAEMAQEAALQL